MTFWVALGARMRELRRAAGLSQAQVAQRTHISRPNIARAERGRHALSLESIERLAAALGLTPLELLAPLYHSGLSAGDSKPNERA